MADLTVDYRYKVLEILHVVDGDTMDIRVELNAHVDFGFGIRRFIDQGTFDIRVRLAHADTWEKKGIQLQRGKAAEAFSREWLEGECAGGHLYVYTEPDKKSGMDKMGNFRRWLATFSYEAPVNGIVEPPFPTLHGALEALGHVKTPLFAIKLNGEDVVVQRTVMSYEKLCELAELNPKGMPSVTYKLADGKQGIMVDGDELPVSNGDIYNAMYTGNG